jgi:hypothetical protein
VFPAASDDQNAIERLIKIPKFPFKEKKIPRNPKANIGKRE